MNNPSKEYWFRRKRYGWGWGLPNVWQGWVVLATYVVALALIGWKFPPQTHTTAFFGLVFLATALFAAIAWRKGEPPGGWHWGD